MAGGYGVMGDDGSIDYTVHEAWNEATNVYLIVILVSFGLFMYAKRNKRRIMRIFSVPPTEETLSEPNFYDTLSKIRLRQQLEMYSICHPGALLLNKWVPLCWCWQLCGRSATTGEAFLLPLARRSYYHW
nr:small integral membrane protein 19 isoform X1 [Aotus nancymaae]XP_021531504.1 small integral membrane protein 19 isoform X1 [Aotus nancymaae]XP_021531505.1 small integral membrane protein 19 isoform X1 [Aotus nancymaae]XP_021531506.1 small integral membrane protein 19 isoform X1 [Aotus nancymaae]